MYIHGKEIAKQIKQELQKFFLINQANITIISCGNNLESQNYIKWKMKDAQELNVNCKHINTNENISVEELKNVIQQEVNSNNINGIILQLPLPHHLEVHKQILLDLIPPHLDIDGLNSKWIAKRYLGEDALYPATPSAIISYLKYNNIGFIGKTVAIVGASALVGRPLLAYLLNERATPIVLQSKSDLAVCQNADIVIVAAGKPQFFKAKYLKAGAFVIDVGTTVVNNKLVGDVDLLCQEKARYVSPVPGGVGPLTRIHIFTNLKYLMKKKLIKKVQ